MTYDTVAQPTTKTKPMDTTTHREVVVNDPFYDGATLRIFLDMEYPSCLSIANDYSIAGDSIDLDYTVNSGDVIDVYITPPVEAAIAGALAYGYGATTVSARELFGGLDLDAISIDNQVFQDAMAIKRSAIEALHPGSSPTINFKQEESTMDTKVAVVSTKTYVNGEDVSRKSDDALINDVRVLEGDIESLGKIHSDSSAIDAKVADLKLALDATIAELDSRHPAPAETESAGE